MINLLNSMNDKLNSIQTTANKKAHQTKTWAEIAATQAVRQQNAAATADDEQERRSREITIRIEDETQRKKVQDTPRETILSGIKEAVGSALAEDLVALRRLPSGALIIQAANRKSKEIMEKEQSWTNTIANSAQVQRKTYPVFVHGVKKEALDTTDMGKACSDLENQNRTIHPGLEIAKIAWPKAAQALSKQYGSVIVETTSPEMANRLITQGIVQDLDIKTTARFCRECRITQCFKCYSYGHMAKTCKKQERCGYCAEEHATKECRNRDDPDRKKCPACGGRHEAWAGNCRKRIQEKERTAQAYKRQPRLYPVQQASSRRGASGNSSDSESGGITLPGFTPWSSQESLGAMESRNQRTATIPAFNLEDRNTFHPHRGRTLRAISPSKRRAPESFEAPETPIKTNIRGPGRPQGSTNKDKSRSRSQSILQMGPPKAPGPL